MLVVLELKHTSFETLEWLKIYCSEKTEAKFQGKLEDFWLICILELEKRLEGKATVRNAAENTIKGEEKDVSAGRHRINIKCDLNVVNYIFRN